MSRVCPDCPTLVPLVSKRLADGIAERLKAVGKFDPRGCVAARLDVLDVSLSWLVAPHPLLRMRQGIVKRAYSRAEKDAIALQEHVVERMTCPFYQGRTCLLGGQCSPLEYVADGQSGPWGWLPALLAAAIDQKSVATLAARGLVADAKLAMLTRRHSFPIAQRGGLAVASSLPELQQEADLGPLSGTVSLRPN